jgi:hypothetical protein
MSGKRKKRKGEINKKRGEAYLPLPFLAPF